MNYAYHPETKELIRTEAPAEWMEQTPVAPPDYDAATQGCFWRGTAWEVVTARPDPQQAKLDTLREIDAMERGQMLPRVTREFMLGYMRATFTDAQLLDSVAYQRLEALDNKIADLRRAL